jgi:hypothetical protein
MSQEQTAEEGGDPLHIGNLIGIVSDRHGLVIGRVIYRDRNLVRLLPQEVSDRAVDFPMTEDGAAFDPDLGVQSIEILEEATSDYYVDFLGARPGEMLEFFTVDGDEADKSGEVAEVIKTATKDSIRLTDGRVLNFRGRGPKSPIAVIRVSTAANIAAATTTGEEAAAVIDAAALAEAAAQKRRTEIQALLSEIVPVATVTVVPAAQQTYPESLQREEMFQDLLSQLSAKQRTNPRRIRYIEREVDLALALKNNVLLRDEAGNPDGFRETDIRTVLDAIKSAPGSVPVAVPIVAGARVLNVDTIPTGTQYRATDVFPRRLIEDVEMESEVLASIYQDGSLPATRASHVSAALQESAAARAAQGFYGYLYDLLGRDQITLKGDIDAGSEWIVDQDVIRTAGLGKAVQGFGSGLPTAADPVSPSLLIDDVTTRSLRVLTPLKYTNPRTGETFIGAPSDPSHVTGYVMLPPKAALKLRPPTRPGDLPTALLYSAALEDDNLPTITQALRDLYSTDPEILNAWTLTPGGPGSDMEIATWLDTVLRYAVHPSESLAPRTPRILGLLDSIGLGDVDMPQSVAAVIHRWVRRSQAQWRDLLSKQRSATQAALNEDVPRVFQSVTGADSPLWPALLAAQAPLSDLIADIRRRNPAIGEAPTLISASIQHEAQGDAAPLAWGVIAGIDNRPIAVDQVTAGEALTASRSYLLRRKALRDLPLLQMRAVPEVNTCPHVATLEAIRNQRDTLQRSRLLREFIEEYQGGRDGEWMTCTLCRQQAVCYHELMELEAMAQPARMAAIQKQILVRFGGSRFEGKIVCRNCGQGLQDIEYDQGVEFDDEGRAVTGMSVLTEEQIEEPTESTWKKATAGLVAAPVEFTTTSQRELGTILQMMAGRAGMLLTPDLIRQIVRQADLYVSARTPTPEAYEAYRKRALTAASTKIRATTGTSGAASYASGIATYAAVIDQTRVVALSALLAIALQAADPPVVVNNPFALCAFSREGWPLVAELDPKESKVLKYISCAIAAIDQPFTPWNHLSWAGEPKLEARTRAVFSAVLSATAAMLGATDTKGPPLSFTPEIRAQLAKMRADEEGARRRALVSHTDQLPVGFRPEPFPPSVGRPAVERDPVAPIAAALSAGRTDEITDLLPGIAGAARQQAVAVIGELHSAASAGVPKGAQINSVDSTCCPVPFAEVEAGALRGAPTVAPLVAAAKLIRGGQVSVPNAGSHLWATFSLPISEPIEQTVDPGVYFKLFLKYCYTGAQVGETHEFSAGNRCRQCGLALGKPLELVDFGKEGAAILAAQEGSLRVEASTAAFEALSQAIRRRRVLDVEVTPLRPAWSAGVLEFAGALEATRSAGLQALATAIRESVTAVDTGGAAAAADELARAQLWTPITLIHDAARQSVADRIGPLIPRGGRAGEARAKEAANALAMVDTLLEDPWIEGPRALQEYWCAKTLAEGRQKFITTVKGARWFKLSQKHNDMINKFLTANSSWFTGELPAEARPVIAGIGELLGPAIRVWIRAVRPATVGSSIAWSVPEAQQLLRATLFQVWQDATSPTSELYNAFTTAADRETIAGLVANWTRILMLHAKQQFVRYSNDRIRQILQQQTEMERTSIVQEFSDIRDDDQRAAEIIKKQYRIGRWARGANLTKLDADRFDEEIEQRRTMGIVDAPVDPLLLEGSAVATAAGNDFGFHAGAPEEASAYDVDQAADGDNY